MGGIVAGRTEDDEQVIHRMAFGGFIGIMIGSLMLFQIAAPIHKLLSFFWDGALIGLAYRWAFKGALIGMILGLFLGIATLFIEGLFPVNLKDVIFLLVFGAYLGAKGATMFWLLFGETRDTKKTRQHLVNPDNPNAPTPPLSLLAPTTYNLTHY